MIDCQTGKCFQRKGGGFAILVVKTSNMMFGFAVIAPLDGLLARFLFVLLLFKVWCVEVLMLGFVLETLAGIVWLPPLIASEALLISGINTPIFWQRNISSEQFLGCHQFQN